MGVINITIRGLFSTIPFQVALLGVLVSVTAKTCSIDGGTIPDGGCASCPEVDGKNKPTGWTQKLDTCYVADGGAKDSPAVADGVIGCCYTRKAVDSNGNCYYRNDDDWFCGCVSGTVCDIPLVDGDSDGHLTTVYVLGAILGAGVIILLLFCGAYFYYRRKPVAEEDISGYHELKDMKAKGTNLDGNNPGAPGAPVNPTAAATTDAAKQACAAAWRNSPKVNTDVSLKTHHHVSYNDIDFARAVEIGDGGCSTVFKIKVYGMPCAVKVLSDSACALKEEQFSAEVEFLSQIQHKNLCRLYACSTDGPQKCLLLELMDGALDSRLMALPSLGWEQRVWIALSSIRALSHLHTRSPPVIHRDVKSQNILVSGFKTDQIDDESVAKVADLGIARTDDRDPHADLAHTEGYVAKRNCSHAITRRVVGTGPYMPPEYRNMGHVSEKTDAFALGIVIFELLISGAIKTEYPEAFPVAARGLVDSEDSDTLSGTVLAMATKGGWAGGNGLLAAKVLTDIAISFTRVTSKRQTPAQVLPQLETAYQTYAGGGTMSL